METLEVGSFSDGQWECFRRMFSTDEHYAYDSPQLRPLLHGEADGNFGVQAMFCSSQDEAGGNKSSMPYTFDSYNNSNVQYIYQESSHISNSHVLAKNSDTSEDSDHSQEAKLLNLKRILDMAEFDMHVEDKMIECGNPKKKSRASKDVKNCMKSAEFNEKASEETNVSADGHSCSSYYTSEEQNATCEENSGGDTSLASKITVPLNSYGKTRASRGSATNPQSLYAKKRRERINERLRILQNMVPNGTKVDISTMLEEAINYVKFLQIQIKLLSSDDLWMYSPIAYNGLDIGLLSQKISPLL